MRSPHPLPFLPFLPCLSLTAEAVGRVGAASSMRTRAGSSGFRSSTRRRASARCAPRPFSWVYLTHYKLALLVPSVQVAAQQQQMLAMQQQQMQQMMLMQQQQMYAHLKTPSENLGWV